MRLIDKDALIQQMKLRHGMIGRQSDPDCLVEDAPTVDAVPVVRCKDCKHFGFCGYNDNYKCGNWFCADGERKEDDGTR